MARSTFVSQNAASDRFLKFRWPKMTRRCGEKHIACESQNVQKTARFGLLFEVQMSKDGTPLWRKADLQVNMRKTPAFWHTLELAMWKSSFIIQLVRSSLSQLARYSVTQSARLSVSQFSSY